MANGRSGHRAGIAIVIAIALAVAGVLALTAMGAGAADDRSTKSTKSRVRHPNILMIMTDDQTVGAMRVLPAVRSLIGVAGVTFTDNIVSFPICCPSRASFLTGEYAHNDGVHANVAPYGSLTALRSPETTLPVALKRAGYDTIQIGKYVNGYGLNGAVTVPPGWTDWNGAVDSSTYHYFGFTLYENGVKRTFGSKPSGYQTDVETNLARRRSGSAGDTPRRSS